MVTLQRCVRATKTRKAKVGPLFPMFFSVPTVAYINSNMDRGTDAKGGGTKATSTSTLLITLANCNSYCLCVTAPENEAAMMHPTIDCAGGWVGG